MATALIGPGISAIGGIVSSIFGGMAKRAAQAKNENSALQVAVQAFDQALQQVQQQYNNGTIDQATALAEVQQIWPWFWKTLTPQIQPNRNGCQSGAVCSGQACAGNIGAACCVGCGAIKPSIQSVLNVLSQGSGVATINSIGGDHYGLQTRLGYQLQFSANSSVTGGIEAAIGSLNGQNSAGLSLKALAPVESALGFVPNPATGKTTVSSTTILIFLAAAGLYVAVKK